MEPCPREAGRVLSRASLLRTLPLIKEQAWDSGHLSQSRFLRRGSSSVSVFSHVRLLVTPWTAARRVPLSMGLSRQEYWSGLPFPSPADLSDPRIEPRSSALKADSLLPEPLGQ